MAQSKQAVRVFSLWFFLNEFFSVFNSIQLIVNFMNKASIFSSSGDILCNVLLSWKPQRFVRENLQKCSIESKLKRRIREDSFRGMLVWKFNFTEDSVFFS